MEQGSKEIKLQGRYPEYTVYSHPIPQRALAIATLILQMKNSEHDDCIHYKLCVLFARWMTLFYVMAIMSWVYTYGMDSVHNGEPERSRVTTKPSALLL